MSITRIDLMASAAGKIGGVTWHHLYLVAYDEAADSASYLRAGPECLPPKHLAGRKTENGDAMEDYEPSPAGPYGVITFFSGTYEPGGVDFDPIAADVTLTLGAAAAQLWEKAQQAAAGLQAEQIPYDPIGKGANWALMEALHRCGVETALPPRRWAPGVRLNSIQPALLGASTRRVGQAVLA
jgi:hypothetical protein